MSRPELNAQKSTPLPELPRTPTPASELPQTPPPDTVAPVFGATPRIARKKVLVAGTAVPVLLMDPSASNRAPSVGEGAAVVGVRSVPPSALFAWPSMKFPPFAAAAGRVWSALIPAAPAAPAAASPASRRSSRRLWRWLPLPLAVLPPSVFGSLGSRASDRVRRSLGRRRRPPARPVAGGS